MTAAYRLKGLGWFGGCTAVVLGFYLVSLQVAAERKKLEHVDAAIAATQRDIRALETEFDTRANLAQLERWNGDTLALSAPQAGQFVADARQLASMDVARPVGQPGVRTAALVVPSLSVPAVAAPAAPAPVAPAPVARLAAVVPAQPRAATAPVVRVAFTAVRPQLGTAPRAGSGDAIAIRPAVALRSHPQVAMLDRKLLSDATLGELASAARSERGRVR